MESVKYPCNVSVKVKKLDHFKGELPKYQSLEASGFDIRACLSEDIDLDSYQRVLIPTGLSFEIPNGTELQVRSRSGLACKQGLITLNSPGTIDSDYRGEVKILLFNSSTVKIRIKDQDKVSQLVLCPVFRAVFTEWDNLNTSKRQDGGFGSTGV